jgi:hypothetical protein
MPENLTAEQREQVERDLKVTKADIKRLQEHEAAQSQRLGQLGYGTTLEGDHRKAASDAELFDSLGAGELARLATEEPERFRQITEAKRVAGERALFNRNSVP